jgi:ribosome maturation factor RimP
MHPAQEIAIKIRKMAEELLSGRSFFVLDVTVSSSKIGRIRLVIDGDKSVTIDDCATLSRELNEQISGSGLLEDYHLEVTTPGVDQPLRSVRQYPKNIGRAVKVEKADGSIVQGKLLSVSENGISIEPEMKKLKATKQIESPKNIDLSFENIKKTFVLISFK